MSKYTFHSFDLYFITFTKYIRKYFKHTDIKFRTKRSL